MNRIMVIGAPGSGKSTLAREIGARLGLPVVHLDRVFWLPGWVERPQPERLRLALLAEQAPEWVIDGNFTATLASRALRADLVVWLDLPMALRLWRVVWRWILWRGRTRPDMQDDCPERLAPEFLWYIVTTAGRSRRTSRALLAGLRDGQAVHLRSPRQVERWLAAFANG